VHEQGPLAALQELCRRIIANTEIKAFLVAKRIPELGTIMPSLITDMEEFSQVDPLAPSFPLNAAKLLSQLTKGETCGPLGALLRPCEVRAFVELVKVNQGSMEDVLLVSFDCFGALPNVQYTALAQERGVAAVTEEFLKAIQGEEGDPSHDFSLSTACRMCEYPKAQAADLHIGLAGLNISESLLLHAHTARGEQVLNKLDYKVVSAPQEHMHALNQLIEKRQTVRDEVFVATAEASQSLHALSQYLRGCVNCHNCRVACPVCYCKECVFDTDVFAHRPSQYLGWANRQGSLTLPMDTIFFHLTRLAHISLSCIGCGQCSNACPNNVPVMELFRTVANKTQKAFGYEAGQNPDAPIPLSVFSEEEFEEVVDHLI
jgi:formate dehydrogenase subunit beta